MLKMVMLMMVVVTMLTKGERRSERKGERGKVMEIKQ